MSSESTNLQNIKVPQYINIGGKEHGKYEWKKLGGTIYSGKGITGNGYKLVVICDANNGRCYGGNLDETFMPNDRKTITGSYNFTTGDLRLVETYYRDGKYISSNDIIGVIKNGKILGKGTVRNHSTSESTIGSWFSFDCKVTFKDASNELLEEIEKESCYEGD